MTRPRTKEGLKAMLKKNPLPKFCIVCGAEYSRGKLPPKCHCQICGETFKDHCRCSKCGISIGNRHLESSPYILVGETVCGSCFFFYTQDIRR